MSSEAPFKIAVSDSRIDLLKKKLSLAVFPDELEDSGRDYGVPLNDVVRLVNRWRDGYDWRVHEKRFNDLLPQFTRPIEVEGHGTLKVHYIHKRSKRVNAIPLLFVHGWPGSFIEVTKILEPLVAPESPEAPAFHVVVIGLPGYGFSEAPKKKGFGLSQYGEAAHKLMLALEYNEYVTQGGDWGHAITKTMAFKYGPKHVKAWHTNGPFAPPPSLKFAPWQFLKHAVTPYSEQEKGWLARTNWFQTEGNGYFKEHSTQPQTIGYSLTDSPVGLLAWIYEKLVSWSDGYQWEDDEVLTWVSIYYFSLAGPTASIRIYYEATHTNEHPGAPTVPLGVSYFPKDILIVPESWIRANANLVFVSRHDSGGHFSAYECPNELIDDIRKFYGRGCPAANVVGGKSGYD